MTGPFGWYDDGHHWVMVVMLAVERMVQLYRSDDLIEWAHLSDFGPIDSAGVLGECPDAFDGRTSPWPPST